MSCSLARLRPLFVASISCEIHNRKNVKNFYVTITTITVVTPRSSRQFQVRSNSPTTRRQQQVDECPHAVWCWESFFPLHPNNEKISAPVVCRAGKRSFLRTPCQQARLQNSASHETAPSTLSPFRKPRGRCMLSGKAALRPRLCCCTLATLCKWRLVFPCEAWPFHSPTPKYIQQRRPPYILPRWCLPVGGALTHLRTTTHHTRYLTIIMSTHRSLRSSTNRQQYSSVNDLHIAHFAPLPIVRDSAKRFRRGLSYRFLPEQPAHPRHSTLCRRPSWQRRQQQPGSGACCRAQAERCRLPGRRWSVCCP